MALEEIVSGVYGIGMGYVNAFFIVAEDGLTLVDSGLAKKKDTILGAVAGAGRQPADLRHILITHHPFLQAMGSQGCIGSPQFLRQKLLAYEEAGVDQVVFLAQAGQIKHEQIIESLALFAREVMPEFQEREEQHQERKRALLSQPVA